MILYSISSVTKKNKKKEIEFFLTGLRAVARSENPGGLAVLGGDNVSPLVEIGLTDLTI